MERGNDGKLKQVELNKFNRQLYVSTFGLQTIPPMAQKFSKERIRLDYTQYKHSLRDNGDMSLQSMMVGEQCLTVAEIMDNPLAKYISLAANDCRYGGT